MVLGNLLARRRIFLVETENRKGIAEFRLLKGLLVARINRV